nr:MAG: ORF1 [Anelloviridae sp.]
MPFWWNRRRKPWYGRWRRYKTKYRRRRRRPLYKRRGARKPYRRRRRRRRKVRRKKKRLFIQQWQPDSIRKCKIIGIGALVIGCEGKQMECYTVNKENYVPPKVPFGGGFGLEHYTLQYLYEEYCFKRNIWTTSNIGRDLCRYLRCKFIFYRHTDTDFIVSYNRQPPHILDKFTYPSVHPAHMLLEKHHRVILSTSSNPRGKYRQKIIIKPPKQMLTKWFFTKTFAPASLFILKGAAMNTRYAYLSASNENMLISLLSLNTTFYQTGDWAQTRTTGNAYTPYHNISRDIEFKYKSGKPPTSQTLKPNPEIFTNYLKSVSMAEGWFQPKILQAYEVDRKGTLTATTPLVAGRYNPATDDGIGNKVYLTSTLVDGYEPPTTDKKLLIENLPLWQALYGFTSYIKTIKGAEYLKSSVVVIQSKHIYCFPQVGSCTKYIPIDYDYTTGKKPYDQTISDYDKKFWYPSVLWQLKTLNSIVEAGPYIPKLSEEKNSTWELKYKYYFFFKWGGPQDPDRPVENPADMSTYPAPDTMPKTIQITNPIKQSTESILHPWDWRRGLIKTSALKRMYQHLETDTDFECSAEESPQKKKKKLGAALRDPEEEVKKIQDCLHSLCEKSTYQETPETIQDLIKQQQQQQQELKYNILQLLFDLKEKQSMLQLQTGLID